MGDQLAVATHGDTTRSAARELRDGVLPAAFATGSPDTILAMPIDILFDFAAGPAQAGRIELNGDDAVLGTFAGVMDRFDPDFDIVTP